MAGQTPTGQQFQSFDQDPNFGANQQNWQNDQYADPAQQMDGYDQGFGSQYQNSPDLLPAPEPEYVVLDWNAFSRHVRPRSRQYYSSLLVILVLFSVILAFFSQMVFIVVLWAVFLVNYILARVQPENVRVQLTTYGVRYQEDLIFWDEVARFWMRDIHGFKQVHLEVPGRMLRQIILLPSNNTSPVQVSVEDIVGVVNRVVPYQEPIPNRFDKWIQWLEEKFPLENQVPVPPVEAPPVQTPAAPSAQTTAPVAPTPGTAASVQNPPTDQQR